jgi:hypothetical protein
MGTTDFLDSSDIQRVATYEALIFRMTAAKSGRAFFILEWKMETTDLPDSTDIQ